MNCTANCRSLNVLDCEWSVKSLKSCIGGQSRIYIRPIQISLNTTPLVADKPSEIKANCHVCGKQVLVRNMQTHSTLCVENFLGSSDSEQEVTMNENSINELSIETPNTLAEMTSESTFISIAAEMLSNEANAPNVLECITVDPVLNEPPVSELSVDFLVEAIANHCIQNDIVDPVEILRYFQKEFVTGRNLDISDPSQVCEGLTNYILVDRANILTTSLDEIKDITDLRRTLQVRFYEINHKSNHLLSVYSVACVGLSTIQNGKVPRFMTEEIINEVFHSAEPQLCVAKLRDGLAKVGIVKVKKQFLVRILSCLSLQ